MFEETIHPRKGTETVFIRFGVFLYQGNNSSPQGDGNAQRNAFSGLLSQKQFIPARGRKLGCRSSCSGLQVETIHPRKGTETTSDASRCSTRKKQFIPARGRKRARDFSLIGVARETIHPRKGTETRRVMTVAAALPETIHPRKGTETARRCY